MSIITINLGEIGGPIYLGEAAGSNARARLKLDELECKMGTSFIVDIPADTYVVNSSFILALFGPSIERLGSLARFKKLYSFETHGREYVSIERAFERALVRYKCVR